MPLCLSLFISVPARHVGTVTVTSLVKLLTHRSSFGNNINKHAVADWQYQNRIEWQNDECGSGKKASTNSLVKIFWITSAGSKYFCLIIAIKSHLFYVLNPSQQLSSALNYFTIRFSVLNSRWDTDLLRSSLVNTFNLSIEQLVLAPSQVISGLYHVSCKYTVVEFLLKRRRTVTVMTSAETPTSQYSVVWTAMKKVQRLWCYWLVSSLELPIRLNTNYHLICSVCTVESSHIILLCLHNRDKCDGKKTFILKVSADICSKGFITAELTVQVHNGCIPFSSFMMRRQHICLLYLNYTDVVLVLHKTFIENLLKGHRLSL